MKRSLRNPERTIRNARPIEPDETTFELSDISPDDHSYSWLFAVRSDDAASHLCSMPEQERATIICGLIALAKLDAKTLIAIDPNRNFMQLTNCCMEGECDDLELLVFVLKQCRMQIPRE